MLLTLLALSADAADFFTPAQSPMSYPEYLEQLDVVADRGPVPQGWQLVSDAGDGLTAAPGGGTGDLVAPDAVKPQIDSGMVTVIAAGDLVGHVWTDKIKTVDAQSGQVHAEHWFLHNDAFRNTPAAGFVLELQDPAMTSAGMVAFLDAEVEAWELDAYAEITFDYIEPPKADDTMLLTYSGFKVQRHPFTLRQNGVVVGRLLRENHVDDAGVTQSLFEHWLFFGGFDRLTDVGDEVEVKAVKGTPPVDTATFFDLHVGSAVTYAQVHYDYTGVGANF